VGTAKGVMGKAEEKTKQRKWEYKCELNNQTALKGDRNGRQLDI
jgi:hypothetical protein